MPPSAITRAFNTIAAAAATRRSLQAVRVLADPGNDQPRAVDAFQDGDDVNGKHGDPAEDDEDAEHAAETERGEADHGRYHDVGEEQDELGNHEDDAVLGVPLHLGVLPL